MTIRNRKQPFYCRFKRKKTLPSRTELFVTVLYRTQTHGCPTQPNNAVPNRMGPFSEELILYLTVLSQIVLFSEVFRGLYHNIVNKNIANQNIVLLFHRK